VIQHEPFGRTGHLSSRVIFGAAALGGMRQDRADALLPVLLEYGINHLDTAASYGDSELRLQPWLSTRRSDFFVATKTGERTGRRARRELERSLERLGVDHVDLVQLHNLVEPGEWEVALGPGGAMEAMAAARDEGLVRFIGVTGHGTRIPGMHLRTLQRFDIDSVLFPYNYSLLRDPGYRSDVEELLGQCADRGVAVQTIKSVARGRWPADYDGPRYSWYEPLPAGDALRRAVSFVLGRPGLFLNTSSDARLLRPILEAAAAHGPVPPDELMAADGVDHGVTPLFDRAELERI
jgi:aryl-alcohol dehydrogenase-like predicted oxidoreductase